MGWAGGGGGGTVNKNMLTYEPSTGILKIQKSYSTYTSGSSNFAEGLIYSFKLYVYH